MNDNLPETIRRAFYQGLVFLRDRGPDTVGLIDSEEKMAAAFMFIKLHEHGYVDRSGSDDGPTYSINAKGLAYIAAYAP